MILLTPYNKPMPSSYCVREEPQHSGVIASSRGVRKCFLMFKTFLSGAGDSNQRLQRAVVRTKVRTNDAKKKKVFFWIVFFFAKKKQVFKKNVLYRFFFNMA